MFRKRERDDKQKKGREREPTCNALWGLTDRKGFTEKLRLELNIRLGREERISMEDGTGKGSEAVMYEAGWEKRAG